MKSFQNNKKKLVNSCLCGSKEFITELNSYDIYELIKGKLEFQHSELIDDNIKIFCRKCGLIFDENI